MKRILVPHLQSLAALSMFNLIGCLNISMTCHNSTDCVEKLKYSLFMVGEIGGNDYNYALFQDKPIEEVKNIVSNVVRAIKDIVRRVIHYGVVRIVVPGNFPIGPIGCFLIYLTRFKTNDSAAYDEHHCLKSLNDFLTYHNDHLQKAIEELKQEYPNAIIAYGDYYNIFKWLFQNTAYLGFNATNLQKACYGTGGYYNFDLTRMCGTPDVPVCCLFRPGDIHQLGWSSSDTMGLQDYGGKTYS